MNKYIKTIIVIAFLSALTGCGKILDLQPAQSISEDFALSNDKNVKNVLLGAYALFAQPGIYGGCLLRDAELLGGNGELQWVGTYIDPRQIYNKTMLATNSEAYSQWYNSYQVINACNNVLSAISVVNSADQNRVEGEARFLRGLMYFDLVRFFGKQYNFSGANDQYGVPLVLTPTHGIDANAYVGRNTVGEIYTQVVLDLTTAVTMLPDDNGVYASKGAANALLSRVYLQMGQYADARDAANEVISSGMYSLNANYADAFNQDDNTTEDIFVTQITPQDRFSSMTEFFSIRAYGGRDGDIIILPGHLNLYPAGDKRKDLFFSYSGNMFCGKWNNLYGGVNLIRLAEMYLVRAECNVRLGTSTGATPTDDYNTIHTRAGLIPLAAGTATLDTILYERRLELAFEGFKIHDIRRLHSTFDVYSWDDDKLVMPIPARELDANPALKTEQNPGY
ncbi:MAG TPA: RagB/SusD family nutrient uptake outer membrane protein [Bacteroidales bacterium]|nr:RagB/SusD family nutrient uptake outer membrane protein [Bacteroidales bacterium]